MNEALTADQVLSMLVGLVRCNDASMIEPGFLHQIGIPEHHHRRVTTLRDCIQRLIDDYDYLQSPVFLHAVAGRSQEFGAMKAKLESQPQNRTIHARSFSDSIASLRRDSRAYELLSASHHHELDAIRELLSALDEPHSNVT